MKKSIALSIALLLALSVGVKAQHMGSMMDQSDHYSMMQGNRSGQSGSNYMMNGTNCPYCGAMMQGNLPMQKYNMMVYTLPNLDENLALTSAQKEKLIDLQRDYKKQQIDYWADLQKEQMKLNSLLSDNASSDKIREEIQVCAGIRTNMQYAAYETAQKMQNELNDDQKSKFNDYSNQHFGMMNDQGNMYNMMYQ